MSNNQSRECGYDGIRNIKRKSSLDIGRTWLPRRTEWTIPQFCEFDRCEYAYIVSFSWCVVFIIYLFKTFGRSKRSAICRRCFSIGVYCRRHARNDGRHIGSSRSQSASVFQRHKENLPQKTYYFFSLFTVAIYQTDSL